MKKFLKELFHSIKLTLVVIVPFIVLGSIKTGKFFFADWILIIAAIMFPYFWLTQKLKYWAYRKNLPPYGASRNNASGDEYTASMLHGGGFHSGGGYSGGNSSSGGGGAGR